MQYIDNDMDDLFKKAGEYYPLRTEGADWDTIQAGLARHTDDAALYVEKKSYRNYRWLLLLLLFIPGIYFLNRSDRKPGIAARNTNSSPSASANGANPPANTAQHPAALSEKKPAAIQSRLSPNVSNPLLAVAPRNNIDSSATIAAATKTSNPPNENRSTNRSEFSLKPSNLLKHLNTKDPENKLSHLAATDKHLPKNGKAAKAHEAIFSEPSTPYSGSDQVAKDLDTANIMKAGSTPNKNKVPLQRNGVPVDSNSAIRQPKSVDSVSINKTNSETAKRKSKQTTGNRHGIYYGLITGPDASSIKSQKIKDFGYTLGVIAGYRINRHWSVETGILWDHKKYYTRGEYFNKAGTNIPDAVTLHYLNGGCNMIEFPLSARYDINVGKNSLFLTGGFTSYVMKKESYNYGADNNGNYYEGFRSYKNSGNYLFSNLQLSAGYTYNFSGKIALRIEPYIKIPVHDIGIGKMPVSSKGVYIGITRSIR